MSFNDFPAELLETVFNYLDGASFCLVQAVCKKWHKVLNKLQNSNKLWQLFCTKEIPSDVVKEMLSFKNIQLENLVIDWKSFYKKWYRGKFIRGNNMGIDCIQLPCDNPITSIKASGSWILTGHSDGDLNVWNLISGKLFQSAYIHFRAITDMALVDLQNLGEYYGSEVLAWSHHHLISISKDTCIKVKSLLDPISSTEKDIVLNKHGDALSSVRVFGNFFAVSCRDNSLSLWSLSIEKQPYFHLTVQLLQTIIGPEDYLFSFGFWNNQIYCVSHVGKLKIFDSNRKEWHEQSFLKKFLNNNHLLHEIENPITAYYLFREHVILMFAANGQFIVCTKEDSYKVYNVLTALRTLILSVVLQGTTLALGGENGRIYVFYVPTTESLLHLNMQCPAFRFTLSEASIVSLDILYDYNSPVIIAGTTECLFIVKWLGRKELIEESRDINYFQSRYIVE